MDLVIGDITIRGKAGTTEGYIPNVPYYINEDDISVLLNPYGEMKSGDFRKSKSGIRCGGLDFTINLKSGKNLPKKLYMYIYIQRHNKGDK